MDIKEFANRNPFLYHLTDPSNAKNIINNAMLFSTQYIAENSFSNAKEATAFLHSKRDRHVELKIGQQKFMIRDQQPVSMKVLDRSLTKKMNAGQFLALLNKRVFWWPNLNRLRRHYVRYQGENPIILRVDTIEMLSLNENVELCHLNSGATRCHPAYGGNAPTRGIESFADPKVYERPISSIAEVTFVESCKLPIRYWTANNPEGKWTLHNR